MGMVLPIIGLVTSVARVGVKATATNTVKKNVTKTARSLKGEIVKPYKDAKKAVNKAKKAVETAQEVKKALYRNKQGQLVIKQKAGRTSVKDPFMRAANQYLSSKGAKDIARIYAQGSRVSHGAEGMWGAKLADGTKGWITERGTFVAHDDVKNVLHSVDATNVAAREGISLEGAWDDMSPAEKAKFARDVDEFDWDSFWKEMYPSKDKASDDDTQTDLYYELLAKLKIAKNW